MVYSDREDEGDNFQTILFFLNGVVECQPKFKLNRRKKI
jgi:hypothetical protein